MNLNYRRKKRERHHAAAQDDDASGAPPLEHQLVPRGDAQLITTTEHGRKAIGSFKRFAFPKKIPIFE